MKSLGYLAPLLVTAAASAEKPRSQDHGYQAVSPFLQDNRSSDCSRSGACLREEPRGKNDNKPTTPPPGPSPVPPFVPGTRLEMPEGRIGSVQVIEVVEVRDSVSSRARVVAAAPQSVARSEAVHGLKGKIDRLAREIRACLVRILEINSVDGGSLFMALDAIDGGYEAVLDRRPALERHIPEDEKSPVGQIEELRAELDLAKTVSVPIRAYVEKALSDYGVIQGYVRNAVAGILELFKEIGGLEKKLSKVEVKTSSNKRERLQAELTQCRENIQSQIEILAGRAVPVNEVRAEKSRRFGRFNERKTLSKILNLKNCLKVGYLSKKSGLGKDDSLKRFELSNIALKAMELMVMAIVDGVKTEVPVLTLEQWETVSGLRDARNLLMRVLSVAQEELSEKVGRKRVSDRWEEKSAEIGEGLGESSRGEDEKIMSEEEKTELADEVDRKKMCGRSEYIINSLDRLMMDCERACLGFDHIYSGPRYFGVETRGNVKETNGAIGKVQFKIELDNQAQIFKLSLNIDVDGESFKIHFHEDEFELTEIRRNEMVLHQEEISMDARACFMTIKAKLFDYLRDEVGFNQTNFEFLVEEFAKDKSLRAQQGLMREDDDEIKKQVVAKKVCVSRKTQEIMAILKEAKSERFKYQGKGKKAERRKWQDEILVELADRLGLIFDPKDYTVFEYRRNALVVFKGRLIRLAEAEGCEIEIPSFIANCGEPDNYLEGVQNAMMPRVARRA